MRRHAPSGPGTPFNAGYRPGCGAIALVMVGFMLLVVLGGTLVRTLVGVATGYPAGREGEAKKRCDEALEERLQDAQDIQFARMEETVVTRIQVRHYRVDGHADVTLDGSAVRVRYRCVAEEHGGSLSVATLTTS